MPRDPYLRFHTIPGGCMVVTNRNVGPDGYFRKWLRGPDGGKRLWLFHRFIWAAHAGLSEVPDGHEVDHQCKNRSCCNPDHLQLLTVTAHRKKDSTEKYADRNIRARAYWLAGYPARELARVFHVATTTAHRWIREWTQAAQANPAA